MSDERSARIETKIDKLTEALSDLRENLGADKEARKEITRRVGDLEKDMKPVKRHVSIMHGIGLVGTVVGLKAIMTYFKGS